MFSYKQNTEKASRLEADLYTNVIKSWMLSYIIFSKKIPFNMKRDF